MNDPMRAAANTESYPLLRTLVVGSDAPFCKLVGTYLSGDPRFDVVAMARNGWDALQLAAELEPMLVIADFAIEDMTGAAIARALKARPKPPVVVVMLSQPSRHWMDISLRAGADDYLLRSEIERLPEVLRQIESDQVVHRERPLPGFRAPLPPLRFRATARAPGSAGCRGARTGLNRS